MFISVLTGIATTIGFVVLVVIAALLMLMAGGYVHDIIRTWNLKYDLYVYDDVARWNKRWRKKARS